MPLQILSVEVFIINLLFTGFHSQMLWISLMVMCPHLYPLCFLTFIFIITVSFYSFIQEILVESLLCARHYLRLLGWYISVLSPLLEESCLYSFLKNSSTKYERYYPLWKLEMLKVSDAYCVTDRFYWHLNNRNNFIYH